jgi:hypothetical protein
MSEKPISPLRQRMLEDMSLRGFRTSTPRGFLPWTLSDDGPGAFPRCSNGPSSETLHTNGPCAVACDSVGCLVLRCHASSSKP